MTDHPIIFSAAMIRALFEGRKQQTRRLAWRFKTLPAVKEDGTLRNMSDRWECLSSNGDGIETWRAETPWQNVKPGDRLWCRETWGRFYDLDDNDKPASEVMTYYRADGEPFVRWLDPDTGETRDGVKWRSPIHCPRAYSRLTLVVTATKIEPLQAISEADAIAEGVACIKCKGRGYYLERFKDNFFTPCSECIEEARRQGVTVLPGQQATPNNRAIFRDLWKTLHGADAWDANPEVVAISGKVFQTNIDSMKEAA